MASKIPEKTRVGVLGVYSRYKECRKINTSETCLIFYNGHIYEVDTKTLDVKHYDDEWTIDYARYRSTM